MEKKKRGMSLCLQKRALRLGLGLLVALGGQNCTNCLVEHLYKTQLGSSRALKVLDSSDLVGLGLTLLLGDGALVLLAKPLDGILVAAEIDLSTDKKHRSSWAMMSDLRSPLSGHVIKGGRADNAEANQEHISLGIRKRSKTIVIFLTSSIPKTKVHSLAIDDEVGTIVIKHCRDIFAGESVCSETDEKASLTDCTITNCDTLDCLHS